MHLDIVEIFLFLTTGGSIVLVALLLPIRKPSRRNERSRCATNPRRTNTSSSNTPR